MSAGSAYAVTLYVVGGDHDAETFVLGPFATFSEAEEVGERVRILGTPETLPMLSLDELSEIVP